MFDKPASKSNVMRDTDFHKYLDGNIEKTLKHRPTDY